MSPTLIPDSWALYCEECSEDIEVGPAPVWPDPDMGDRRSLDALAADHILLMAEGDQMTVHVHGWCEACLGHGEIFDPADGFYWVCNVCFGTGQLVAEEDLTS